MAKVKVESGSKHAGEQPIKTLPPLSLGVVGTGAMAQAMIAGLLDRGLVPADRIRCSHPRPNRRQTLESTLGVATVAGNAEAVDGADVVLIAVKPQVLPRVMPELAGRIPAQALVVSVVAGASTGVLGRGLAHPALVRAMPNTPAQIGSGVTVWYGTPEVDERAVGITRLLLSALGSEIQVEQEEFVAMATAVSGTGPTYTFLFVEAMIDAAVHLGFPRHVARRLVVETVVGSAEFAAQSDRHVAELRDMVTSPGGTSAAALAELERGRFRTVLSDSVWAAYRRTLELEAGLAARSVSETERDGKRSH
ncbi:MAG: pyrroline-5-carboxylate reductase [Candidatus Dormibacteria bacterium]|jgi:pyrroline-5-carboxylate reductase